MDVDLLKEYILNNDKIIPILEELGCHHIRDRGTYISCGNPDGDNSSAISVYKNDSLYTIDYTREIQKEGKWSDLFTLVEYFKDLSFFEAVKQVCDWIDLDYYHNFEEEIPKSLQLTKMIMEMRQGNLANQEDIKVKPIPETILSYYKPYVNDLFFQDHIDYETQRDFEIGYDDFTNRITIPIRDELGTLVGVKGRALQNKAKDGELKYIYIEPVARSKILYGLYRNHDFIKQAKNVFVVEAEKGVMQAYSYGYRNVVATGGKKLSKHQIDMLTRLGVDITLCFDKDVEKKELVEIANKFIDGVPVYAAIDRDNLLDFKESPTDDYDKFIHLIEKNIVLLR